MLVSGRVINCPELVQFHSQVLMGEDGDKVKLGEVVELLQDEQTIKKNIMVSMPVANKGSFTLLPRIMVQ